MSDGTPRVTLKLEDPRGALGRLSQVASALGDLHPLWERLEPAVYDHFNRWLDSSGGGSWEPLSPAYAEWKAANFPGRKIMERTGDLSSSLRGPGARGSVRRLSAESAEWGTDIRSDSGFRYAQAHQEGVGHLPERKLVVLTSDLRRKFLEEAGDLMRLWLRSGP